MTKLKLIGIFVCFLVSWLLYHYIDKKPNLNYKINLKSTNSILPPPRYYTAKEIKQGKVYQIIQTSN